MKWEYKTIKLETINFFRQTSFGAYEVDEFINEFGQDGWELVSTVGVITDSTSNNSDTNIVILFFKRPLVN